ncbi:MAG: hypothetical protein JJE52_16460, partial [Acidimicrobiia bacterium]|nr:hypothetical protein [Acidimicrobiia bacterium]
DVYKRQPLPYQGCDDAEPAAGTDGTSCLQGRYDHDFDPANGCEAVGDDIDETRFTSGSIEGTIIPEGDVDKVLVPLADRWQLFCDAHFELTLTAPSGLDLEMSAFDDGRRIAQVEVAGGGSEPMRLGEPSCAQNDSTTLEVIIRAVDGRSSDPWILERAGSW